MKRLLFLIVLLAINYKTSAQSLDDILEQETPKTTEYVSATFKGTRILNGHSIENRKKGVLEFIISHRFGRVNLGVKEFFGLDDPNIRFALEKGFTNKLMAGIGRSSYEKTYDAFIKYNFLKQKLNDNSSPVTASLFGSVAYKSIGNLDPDLSFNERLTYVTQVLVARKFSPYFSLQVMPGLAFRKNVDAPQDPTTIFSVGTGGRVKLTKRTALSFEYHYVANPLKSIDTTNSLAFGYEIESGGHVFQLILSNSITMIEKSFITEGTGDFFSGDIHIGFNISRAFHPKHKKKKTKKPNY